MAQPTEEQIETYRRDGFLIASASLTVTTWYRSAGGTFHAPDDWLAHVRQAKPAGAELDLVAIEVAAGGAAFHDGWTFHCSPLNERADAQRRSIISHLISTDTRWSPAHNHPILSRYRRPGEIEIDEAFFPVLWQGATARRGWTAAAIAISGDRHRARGAGLARLDLERPPIPPA